MKLSAALAMGLSGIGLALRGASGLKSGYLIRITKYKPPRPETSYQGLFNQMAGEAERTGLTSEDDVMALVKKLRNENE